MSYSVIPVSKARQMKDFLNLPFKIYRHDPNWVPPFRSEVRRVLDERQNPYFTNAKLRLFVCYKDATAVARVAIIINRLHQEKFGEKAAFFGFFESANDLKAARHLFDKAAKYSRSQGIKQLEGPFNPNHYSELGLQVDQFGTPPTFFQPYNPDYYNQLLKEIGFHISVKFHTRKNENIRQYVHDRYGSKRSLPRMGNYTLRSFSKKDIKAELERFREVNNDAFSSNWHFLPLSKEEYLFSAKYLRLVTRPDLIKIVEHDGNPVGILHCVLDINPALKKLKGKAGPIKLIKFLRNKKKIQKLIIFSVGIKKAYQHGPAFLLLFNAFSQICPKYEVLETTWMSEENTSAIKAAEYFGLKPDKQFVIYKKHLSG
ncbi:MAG: hypothetical protein GTO17_11840 [Candidatus Aminicenantes bacterium]|nr:hypothetical protein [Candidatus Aminicenantes bacterium]